MTQEEALQAAKELFPAEAEFIQVERTRAIGCKHGHDNTFYIWNFHHKAEIIASSTHSWEHAIAIVKSRADDPWPEDDSPVEASDGTA